MTCAGANATLDALESHVAVAGVYRGRALHVGAYDVPMPCVRLEAPQLRLRHGDVPVAAVQLRVSRDLGDGDVTVSRAQGQHVRPHTLRDDIAMPGLHVYSRPSHATHSLGESRRDGDREVDERFLHVLRAALVLSFRPENANSEDIAVHARDGSEAFTVCSALVLLRGSHNAPGGDANDVAIVSYDHNVAVRRHDIEDADVSGVHLEGECVVPPLLAGVEVLGRSIPLADLRRFARLRDQVHADRVRDACFGYRL